MTRGRLICCGLAVAIAVPHAEGNGSTAVAAPSHPGLPAECDVSAPGRSGGIWDALRALGRGVSAVLDLSGISESRMRTADELLSCLPGLGVSAREGRPALLGRSSLGRPILLRQFGDAAVDGEVLVVGCIHGDECAARGIRPAFGCPPRGVDLYTVGNLNPDGRALGTRLNGRGVDLNRNFPVEWKPIGTRGSPQHSGPRPLSEPESRLAARLIRRLHPEVTIWFHQHPGAAFVRAWGQSIRAARRYASLARLPFRPMPWPAGTAPNWQNNTFAGTASFVVELHDGPRAPRLIERLGIAAGALARVVAEGGAA